MSPMKESFIIPAKEKLNGVGIERLQRSIRGK
jgi:hypothetical protein